MAITTRDSLIAAIAASVQVKFAKSAFTASTSAFFSTFRSGGVPVSTIAIPGASGAALDRTSSGALLIPAPSNTTYILGMEAGVLSGPVGLILADRLVETSGLNGTVTSAQTVNSAALPSRATGALDVELWLEIYTALGTGAVASVTASYTNQSGTSGRTATLVGGIPASGGVVQRMYLLSLQAGDTGVQSVQSVTLGSTTGTAGNFGVVLRRTLLFLNIPVGAGSESKGYADTDLVVCPDNACLEIMYNFPSTASQAGYVIGDLTLAQA